MIKVELAGIITKVGEAVNATSAETGPSNTGNFSLLKYFHCLFQNNVRRIFIVKNVRNCRFTEIESIGAICTIENVASCPLN